MVDTGNLHRDMPVGFVTLLSRLSAAVVCVISLRLLMYVYSERMTESYQVLMIIVALLGIILFRGVSISDLDTSRNTWSTVVSVCASWILMFAILLVLGYATKSSEIYSRKLLFTWLMVTPILLVATYVAIETLIARLAQAKNNSRRVVIAGANELGLTLAKKIRSSRHSGMTVAGFFDDRSAERLGSSGAEAMLGRLQDLPEYLRSTGADVIFIALPMRNISRVSEMLNELHDTTASIYYVPDVFVFDLIQCRTGDIDGMPVVALCETPFYGTRGVVKRISDFVIATLALIALSPLFLAIAIGIKLTSPGPVIFKQRRYGLDGEEIMVYKFRTMTVWEDGDVIRQATRDDARVTKIGAVLRKYSLDELPQFFNVLQGRMSVVGPRPHAIAHNEEYRRLIKGYMIRHKVSPGITGLAQVSGFRGETNTVEDMARRVECDLDYLRNWSLGLDLKIIFRTALVVLKDKKAY
jgi:putative colanic acid biosynthesis UDP-glucose lipid carrier transferase